MENRKWYQQPFWETLLWTLIILVSIFILALWTARSRAAWGPGGCGPVGPARIAKSAFPFTGWKLHQGRYYYFQDGIQIAGYDPKEQVYRRYNAGDDTWSEPQRPPWKTACRCCPQCTCEDCRCAKLGPCCRTYTSVPVTHLEGAGPRGSASSASSAFPEWMTHGVCKERISDQERCTVNGKDIGDDRIPDDAKRVRLTIIGSEDEQKKVTEDLNRNPLLTPHTLHLVVRNYAPDHWHVAQAGFDTKGHPSIYLQAPDGKVLHHSARYEGPERLARAVVGARRIADPKYDPAKDPDLSQSNPLEAGKFSVPACCLIGLGVLALLTLSRRNHS
jgi:hypothetical protein